jgi:glycosyltransferase involved in cell wall biosynthesis
MKQTQMPEQNSPLISVYLPTHNRSDLVGRAVNSVLAQDYSNFELIIVNDASSDETREMLETFYGLHTKVHLIHLDESKGPCYARNIAIKKANGELITGIDDDDEFLPHRLSSLYSKYSEEYSFVCSGYIWDYGHKSRERFISERKIDLNDILSLNEASNQVLVKTSRLRDIGGFDLDLVSCQDYDLWVRLISEYGEAFRINRATYIVHVGHEKERVSNRKNRMLGYLQFFEKHKSLMNEKNITNQSFLRIVASEEKLTSVGLIQQIIAGYPLLKLRYFLSSRFKYLAKLRKRYLKHGKIN